MERFEKPTKKSSLGNVKGWPRLGWETWMRDLKNISCERVERILFERDLRFSQQTH